MLFKEITISSAHNLRVNSMREKCVMGGSLAIPKKLMDELDLVENQQVVVKRVDKGGMEITYLIYSDGDDIVESHGSVAHFAPTGSLICFFVKGIWDGKGVLYHKKFYNDTENYSNLFERGIVKKIKLIYEPHSTHSKRNL